MKGSAAVITELNNRLSQEFTGISQYMTHSSVCENWGYKELGSYIKRRAIEEMKHAEALIERILFLEGIPEIRLNHVNIGENVQEIMDADHETELEAVKNYNKSIAVCLKEGDNGTRQLFESIVTDEEKHVDNIESQLVQIKQMKLENYLTEQI
jgi:bacterioferritin